LFEDSDGGPSMPADLDDGYDEQDQSEVFDEDNIDGADRGPGEDPEQLEDLPDVYDVTSAVGDEDDDDGEIGDEMDDDEIVALARDGDGDGDLEDDDLRRREAVEVDEEEDLEDLADVDAVNLDEVDDEDPDEVELEYAGDLADRDGAGSAAQGAESDRLSDRDLRELDYKDGFTRDDGDEEDEDLA
jgi:hypothetical protein